MRRLRDGGKEEDSQARSHRTAGEVDTEHINCRVW